MRLIRIVPPSNQNFTYGGTFSINCKDFCNIFYNYNIKHFHIKKINLPRTLVSTDTLSSSCLLQIKACFVGNYRNCTTLPYILSINITYYEKHQVSLWKGWRAMACEPQVWNVLLISGFHTAVAAVALPYTKPAFGTVIAPRQLTCGDGRLKTRSAINPRRRNVRLKDFYAHLKWINT